MANGKGSHGYQDRGGGPTKKWAEKIRNLESMSKLSAEELVNAAEEVGRYLTGESDRTAQLKTSQIRKFLDAVCRIKTESTRKSGYEYRQMTMFLKPQLAYAAGRNRAVTPLMELLGPGVDKINTKEDFLTLYKLVESIIAYHKYDGGRD